MLSGRFIKIQAHILQNINYMFKKLIYYIAPVCLKIILFVIFITCKWKVYNKEFLHIAQKTDRPVLICCWHNNFLLVARYFKKISLRVWAVSSTHRDSQIMAKILSAWNFKLIKGSSTRGWRNVLKSMMKLFNNTQSIVAVTNDGPKGPAFVAKTGAVSLALKKGVQIITVSGTATKYWSLPSWDQTIIPKPFSTIHIQFARPFSGKVGSTYNESVVVSRYMNNNYNVLKQRVRG